MNYQPYPKYKESGVQWLGEVPEHWAVKRSDGILVSDRNQMMPGSFRNEDVFHYSIPAIQEYGTGIIEEGESIASAKQLITEKCLLVSKLNPRKATICIAEPKELKTLCSTELVVLKARKCALGYLNYFVQTELFRQGLDSKVQSVTRSHQRASPEDVYKFWAAWPLLSEQTAIANFLDSETGRIDTLIARNKKLIALLKEERSALISRTVTRGLPEDAALEFGLEPHTRFKESGVEWLGEVPEHWEIWKLAHLTKRIGSGKTPTGGAEVYQNEGVIFLRSQNVYDDGLYLDDVVYIDQKIDEEMAWSRVERNDILLNITGASLGRTCIVPHKLPKSNVNQHVCVIRLNNTDYAEYISLYLKSKPAKAFYDFVQTGSAREGLNFQQVGAFPIPLPPQPEQQTITAFLDSETAKIDKLIEKVVALITRLKEYRTALITDAVTGKMDLREIAA